MVAATSSLQAPLSLIGAAALCAMGASMLRSRSGAKVSARRVKPRLVLRAEPEEGPEGLSILGTLREEDRKESEEATRAEADMEKEMAIAGFNVNEDEVVDVELEELSEVELARRGARQQRFVLTPSPEYVTYIAKQKAVDTWKKSDINNGNLECQIACLTETIRGLVVHAKENTHDYSAREKLISLVALRRRKLDKLSWSDVNAYIKIRTALKIRHNYRMEALIGRLSLYKYSMKNRKNAPGRRVYMRYKKARKLQTGRYKRAIETGKTAGKVRMLNYKLKSRKWASKPADEAKGLIRGVDIPGYLDALAVP